MLAARPAAYVRTFLLALRHRVPGLRALLWALFHFGEAIELSAELRERGIGHLHNHFANSAANVGFLASRFLGIPWSLTLHGISEFDYPAGVLLADKVRAATHVACVSHFGRAQAMRIVEPEHWEKMFLARCGIEVHALPSVAPEPSDGRRLRVLCVGRLSPEKGHIGLIQAFARCVASGVDAELRIAGDGPDAARIAEAVQEAGLGERCRLLGRLAEPEALVEMGRADLFVSASFMEGLPVVLMEALGMNVAVVAPCVAGIPELVEHRVSGWLFSPGDWDALARTLEEALGDAALRERFARVGRSRVLAEFDVERAVEPIAARFGAIAESVRG